mmetsp:Transcript_2502/g.7127  ORF Transcript_2502/g.7127 Transcript_2502/m.7127 type:complete len:328 (-) Transcript_2502:531-1514(-)
MLTLRRREAYSSSSMRSRSPTPSAESCVGALPASSSPRREAVKARARTVASSAATSLPTALRMAMRSRFSDACASPRLKAAALSTSSRGNLASRCCFSLLSSSSLKPLSSTPKPSRRHTARSSSCLWVTMWCSKARRGRTRAKCCSSTHHALLKYTPPASTTLTAASATWSARTKGDVVTPPRSSPSTSCWRSAKAQIQKTVVFTSRPLSSHSWRRHLMLTRRLSPQKWLTKKSGGSGSVLISSTREHSKRPVAGLTTWVTTSYRFDPPGGTREPSGRTHASPRASAAAHRRSTYSAMTSSMGMVTPRSAVSWITMPPPGATRAWKA